MSVSPAAQDRTELQNPCLACHDWQPFAHSEASGCEVGPGSVCPLARSIGSLRIGIYPGLPCVPARAHSSGACILRFFQEILQKILPHPTSSQTSDKGCPLKYYHKSSYPDSSSKMSDTTAGPERIVVAVDFGTHSRGHPDFLLLPSSNASNAALFCTLLSAYV